MSKHSNFLTNILFSAISWSSSLVFLVILILAARLLGDDTYGQFAFAFSLVALFGVTADIGMKTYMVREVARAPTQTAALLGCALALKTVLSAATVIMIAMIVFSMDLTPDVRLAIGLLTLAMISRSYKLLWRGILVANERFQREAMVVAIDRGFLLLATTLALSFFGGLVSFVAAYCVASVLGLGITYAMTGPKLRRPDWSLTISDVVSFVKGSLPFGLTTAAFLLYLRIDSVMLGIMRDDVEVGWYNAAYRLIEGMIIFPMILQYVLFPKLSVLHTRSMQEVNSVVTKSGKHLIALGVLLAVVNIAIAAPMIQLIYGEQYAAAALPFQLLLGGLTFMFLASLLRDVVNAVNRPHVALAGGVLGAAVNIALNFYLIPRYGYLGTSVSTVAAEASLFSVLIFDLRRQGYRLNLSRSLLKPAIALVPCVLAIVVLANMHFTIVAVAGLFAYVGGLIVLRYFDDEEIAALALMRRRVVQRFGRE